MFSLLKNKKLLLQIHLAFLILTTEEFLGSSKPNLMFAIDPYHFSLWFNPHLDLHDLIERGGVAFPAQSTLRSKGTPREIFLNGDNQHVSPHHQKWGIYSNYASEMIIYGEELWEMLKDILEEQVNERSISKAPNLCSFKAFVQ